MYIKYVKNYLFCNIFENNSLIYLLVEFVSLNKCGCETVTTGTRTVKLMFPLFRLCVIVWNV